VEVQNRFSLLSNEEASDWDTFRNAVTGADSTCLGHAVQPKKEWITDSSWQLIEEKKVARLQGRVEDYKRLTKQCKTQLRKDRQHWADDMAELGELALETGQMKDAFANFRKLRSAGPHVNSPILSSSGQLQLTERPNLLDGRNIMRICSANPSLSHQKT